MKGSSKTAAKKLASTIVTLQEGVSSLDALIGSTATQMGQSSSSEDSSSVLDHSLELNHIISARDKLKARITRSMRLLTGGDSATASLVKKAFSNDLHALVFKCRAYLARIHSKVLQAKFAAVPYERRVSQAKGGELVNTIGLEIAPPAH